MLPVLLSPLEGSHHEGEVGEVVALAHSGRRVGGGHAAAGVGPAPARKKVDDISIVIPPIGSGHYQSGKSKNQMPILHVAFQRPQRG